MAQDIWSIARVAEGALEQYDVGGRQMLAQSTATSHNSSTELSGRRNGHQLLFRISFYG